MEAKVSLQVFSSFRPDEIRARLAASGIGIEDDAGLTLAVADDYVHRGLAPLNRELVERRRPWLLCKPVGGSLWAGPALRPGESACWACLRHRLVENRWQEHELWRSGGVSAATGARATPELEALLWRRIVREVRGLAESGASELDGRILTYDGGSGEERWHTVFRRADCSVCSRSAKPRARSDAPIETRIARNFSEITGIVSELGEVTGPEWHPIRVVVARCILPLDARAPLLGTSPELVVGRSLVRDDAVVACLAEGCERYSAFYQGNERLTRARFHEIADRAVHPRDLVHFSARQYANGGDDSVPVPYDENVPIDWVEAESLTSSPRFVPAAFCYLGHLEPAHPFCAADSNGCAAGRDHESAVEGGLRELIERDAAATWWYNRLSAPALPFDGFDEEFLRRVPEIFAANGKRVWLLQLPTDWRAPVVAALCCDAEERSIHYAFAAGAKLESTARSAVTELVQTLLSYERRRAHSPDDPRVRWIAETSLTDLPFLYPRDSVKRSPTREAMSDTLRERALELGLDVLTIDLSRPEVDVPVVRVVVPGMRSLRPRFGPGRLYDLPVKLGLRSEPLCEERLNPDPVL